MTITPKKSLGQNFLTNEKILSGIADAGKLSSDDTILEIGPGNGDLTKKLLEKASRVLAVEKDDRLISILNEKFSKEIAFGKFELIHADIMEFDLNKHLVLNSPEKPSQPNADQGASENRTEPYIQYDEGDSERVGNFISLRDKKSSDMISESTEISNVEMRRMRRFSYKIIANIPYYLTGAIIRKFLEIENKPSLIVLTLQKEVVMRIIEEKGSILGMSIRAYGQPSKLSNISRSYFKPIPNVDSAILLIDEISNRFFEKDPKITKDRFFEVLKTGFKQKRKKLISNLSDLATKESLIKIFKDCNLEENIRAEELKLEDWRKLTSSL